MYYVSIFEVPTTEEEWQDIAKEFEEKWDVYNTTGAMDRKHIQITCPQNSGSQHFNYKSYIITLFALVHENYIFIYIDVGTNNRIGNAGVYAKSALGHCLMNRTILKVPDDKKLPNTNNSGPYVVLADNVLSLSYNVMKPHP
jgi:hypothetical protein